MSEDTAYRSGDPEVITAWNEFKIAYETVDERRDAMSVEVGRKLYVQRSGFGHGTRVVGFERFESDRDGDTLHHDGCLIVSSKRGHHGGLVVPNLRRKSGKTMDAELRALATPTLALPGMPPFHLYSDETGTRSGSPALWMHDGIVYALWPCDSAPVKDNWETIPLSVYYAAKEKHDTGEEGPI